MLLAAVAEERGGLGGRPSRSTAASARGLKRRFLVGRSCAPKVVKPIAAAMAAEESSDSGEDMVIIGGGADTWSGEKEDTLVGWIGPAVSLDAAERGSRDASGGLGDRESLWRGGGKSQLRRLCEGEKERN